MIYSKWTITVHVFLTWAIPVALLSPALLRGERSFIYDSRVLYCLIDVNNLPVWFMLIICSLIMGCILLCSICYLIILRKVRQSRVRIGVGNQRPTDMYSKRDLSLFKTVFTVFAAYLILSLPITVVTSFLAFRYNVSAILFQWSVYFTLSNSVVNGFIYGITNRKFRRGYMKFVIMLFCCRRPSNEMNSSNANITVLQH